MTLRVAIVDDDEINRRGLGSTLQDFAGEFEVVVSLNHQEAVDEAQDWRMIDIVIVDAADERCELDQFPGVGVVEAIRGSCPSAGTLIVVVTGHFFHQALRRRMREAGADYLYHRSELYTAAALRQALLQPQPEQSTHRREDLDTLVHHGVSERTRVNRAVRFAHDHGLLGAPEGLVGRRAWMRLRREFNREARLTPVNSDGLPPNRQQAEPSLGQIERFLSWATKVDEAQSRQNPESPDRPR